MKKFIALAAVALMGISCSDDDSSETNGGSASIEGTWKLTAFTLNEGADLNNDGTVSTDMISESGCYSNSSFVFSSNNVATINIEELEIDLDLVIGTEDSYEYSIDCVEATPEVGTYAVSGNTVTITGSDGEGGTESIPLALSNNTLTLTLPEFVDVPVEENGEVTYSFVGASLVFTKQ
ncbi:hypothetical protein GCM10007424_08010 [Flavobacterium suaedae]|uniref:Lipocalin-like domain-containing protein n=1 Tax=Flavobacterium suaedae TaxID=1767027 RepID=A0ABQ1JN38_9FLAO|nr:lipocalin family protein [Flavobacterium suaedae]GGB70450.1 hypothetical protein GCM10007424_08010 [Flavobacterium suaedae]